MIILVQTKIPSQTRQEAMQGKCQHRDFPFRSHDNAAFFHFPARFVTNVLPSRSSPQLKVAISGLLNVQAHQTNGLAITLHIWSALLEHECLSSDIRLPCSASKILFSFSSPLLLSFILPAPCG